MEYEVFSEQAVAFVAVGDFNVHNKSWLRFSNADSPEGTELESVCCALGLRQHVKEPTRGPYLLDLVLSDFQSGVTCKVTPGIHDRDHRGVMAKVRMDIPAAEPVQRRVFNFKKANWNQLKGSLLARDWRGILAGSADDAAADITQVILDTVAEHIPIHKITDKVYAHPWLDDTCRLALQRRNDAEGTPNYNKARDECSQTFLEARSKHAVKVRNDLKGMSVSSRGWWRLAGSLLAPESQSRRCSAQTSLGRFPPQTKLRNSHGSSSPNRNCRPSTKH